MTLRSTHLACFTLTALLAVAGCGDGDGPPAPDAAVTDSAVMDAAALAPLGEPCTAALGCESGHCVDGICCESGCDAACETGMCGSIGACVLAGADTVCRAAAGACDVEETCSGSSAACPNDGFADASTECRAAAGECDAPELCPGDSAACPSDVLLGGGIECRPVAGDCDVAETCSGADVDCPADAFADAGTACGTYQCGGDAAACPTSCAGHADCSAGSMCVAGACIVGLWAFTTSGTHDGNLGGLAGADGFCQGFANTAGLPGIYRAWLSDSTGSPSTRFTHSTIPWVMPSGSSSGIILADDWADLTDGSIDARLVQTEAGATVSNNIPFTNTTPAGVEWNGADCSDWTSTSGNGSYGNTGGLDGTWTQSGSGGACNVLHRYYCFQM